MVLMTMKSLLEQLPPEQFMRVHKSYIVNLEKVEKFNGSQVEVEGQSIPLSRNKKILLEEALMDSSS
ncbi:MAG TPA: LytTR family transcriptional regulator, partial [Pricia sp.]|nr:LytTR family transcriptional regulator [Pricia sp.]